jgi:predicted DNA-binding protein
MKTFKTRHQLFLSEEISRRLAQRAKVTGRTRSDILVEALEAWFNRRSDGGDFRDLAARLTGIERRTETLLLRNGLFWEAFARLLRNHMMTTASLPAPDAADMARATRNFEKFIDEMVDRLAGGEVAPSDDPGIAKLRRMH